MKKIRRKVIFAKRNQVQTSANKCKQAVYEIYGTYNNLCITSVQYSKNMQNVQK